MSQSRRPMGHRRWRGAGAIRKAFGNRFRTSILTGTAALLASLTLTLVTPPSFAQAGPLSPGEAVVQPLLQPGDSGPPVETLQQKLTQHEIYLGVVDGVYGAETVEAVRSLQRQQGLTVDGIVGAQTWQALAQNDGVVTLPSPLLQANLVAFTPLVVAAPPPPPSALWLALMPLVPITGGALTYLQRQLRRRRAVLRRRARHRRAR